MSSYLLRKLDIRNDEKSIFINFFLFNLILYAGIFLGRAIRDALFFSKVGAEYLPYIFIANAVSMSIFGTFFSKWTGTGYSLKKVAANLFTISGLIILFFAFLFSVDLQIIYYGFSIEKITIGIFYWITEIPILLMLILIWIISESYISESMGQRLNPKIIGGGHIGIVIGGCIAVFSPSFFHITMQSLTYVWGGLLLLAMLMTLIVYKICPPLPKYPIEEDDETIPETQTGFFNDFIYSFKVIKKYKYSFYFAMIALFNFFLFGINDYMLNTRAIAAGVQEEKMIEILGYFTIGFGLVSAFVQFIFITKLIKKIGVAKANLGGGIIFVFFSFFLLLTSTNMFEPVQKLIFSFIPIKSEKFFLYVMASVRFGGYVAEYLFNQTMLPPLYGAIPDQDREVTRSFIEGTFVQMVFGLTGIFLLIYEAIFDNNLDLLIVLGFVSATLMLTFCVLMKKEYKEMIKLTKKAKVFFLNKIMNSVNLNKDMVKQSFDKDRPYITCSLINLIAIEKNDLFIEDIYSQFGKSEDINIAVISAIIELNNTDYYNRLLQKYCVFMEDSKKIETINRRNLREIRTLFSGFYKMHHNYEVLDMFENIENSPELTNELKQEIVYLYSKLDNKNGIIRANRIIESMPDKNFALKLSAEIGFDNFADQLQIELAEIVDNKKDETERLSELLTLAEKINYSSQKRLFEIFIYVLHSFNYIEIRKTSLTIAKNMISKNYFLAFIAIDYLMQTDNLSAQKELPFLILDIPPIPKIEIQYFEKNYSQISTQNIPLINDENNNEIISINKLLESLILKGQPTLSLNACIVLFNRIKQMIEPYYQIENPRGLFDHQLKKLYLSWILLNEFEESASLKQFIQNKINNYKLTIIYIIYFFTGTDDFKPELYYKNILSSHKLLKDNAISIFEQILERDVFRLLDNYFYIDDVSNPSRTADLSAKAKELYPEETQLDHICKIMNIKLLDQLTNF